MKPSSLFRCALGYFAVAVLTACSGSQCPSLAPTTPTRALAIPPDAGGRDLLYVSSQGNAGYVYVYTYPEGKLLGSLANFEGAEGLCVDETGDIFIPFYAIGGGIDEFAHGGGSPIATLSNSYAYEVGCSVSPTTGQLAVIGGYHSAYVTIYNYKPEKGGWKIGRSYADAALLQENFCGYDNLGNLFVDGTTSSGSFALTELPAGGKTFITITLSQDITAPGGVQFDGLHLAVGDGGVSPSVIYQFDVSGSSVTEVGSTKLDGSQALEQFWIHGGRVVAAESTGACGQKSGCIGIYRYPAGGSAIRKISLSGAFGATVSLAPK